MLHYCYNLLVSSLGKRGNFHGFKTI
ncbi:MAG TPA: hypothetical protein DEQ06_01685 [Porphyromonadaceae bacterium]|nr:hypothetical protein [Porphyromonadaceae bacterium]